MAHRTLENDLCGPLLPFLYTSFPGGPEGDPHKPEPTRFGDMSGGFTPDNRPGRALKRASQSRWHRLIAYISGDPTDVIAPERTELYRAVDDLENTVSSIIPIVDDLFPR